MRISKVYLIAWLKVREGSHTQKPEIAHRFWEKLSIERDRNKPYLKTIWYHSEEVKHLKLAPYNSPLTFSELKHWINIKN